MEERPDHLPGKDEGIPHGIYTGISNEQYHRGPGISNSGLVKILDSSPGHYEVERKHPKPPKDHYTVGSACHSAVLEPDVFKKEFVKDPFPGERTKKGSIVGKETGEAKIAREELVEAGKTIVHTAPKGPCDFWGRDDWKRVHEMRDAIHAHPTASIFLDLSQGQSEQSAYWMDEEVNRLCRCRPDFLNDYHNVAVDLKTTIDASFTGFGKSAGDWKYFMQDPFYSDGLRAVGRPVGVFVFVVIEKLPPYGIGIYYLKPEERRTGRTMYRKSLEIYSECKKNDEWPIYPPEVRGLDIPPWALRGNIN